MEFEYAGLNANKLVCLGTPQSITKLNYPEIIAVKANVYLLGVTYINLPSQTSFSILRGDRECCTRDGPILEKTILFLFQWHILPPAILYDIGNFLLRCGL